MITLRYVDTQTDLHFVPWAEPLDRTDAHQTDNSLRQLFFVRTS